MRIVDDNDDETHTSVACAQLHPTRTCVLSSNRHPQIGRARCPLLNESRGAKKNKNKNILYTLCDDVAFNTETLSAPV